MRVLRVNRVIVLFLLFAGCQTQDTLLKSTGTEYFPMKVGLFWEYDVVETVISQVSGQTTELYTLRHIVTDSLSSSGERTFIIQRSRRADANSAWSTLDTWSVRLSTFQAIMQEGNVPFVRMQFPLSEGKSWNGNSLNNLTGSDACADGSFQCDNYQVVSLGKAFQTTGLSYSNSVTIVENNEDDPIVMQDVRKSVYAASVGLVYRELSQLEYCTIGACIGQKVVENGLVQKQTLTAHGTL